MTSEEAIRDYRWLVEAVARDMLRPGLDKDDLVQEGFFGLLHAAEEWTAGTGVSFVTRARSRIKNAIRDYERSISFDDRCADVSLDSACATDGEGDSLHDFFGSPPDQDDVVARHERIDAVREGLRVLSTEDRELLRQWTECHSEGDHRKGEGAIPEMSRRTGVPRTTLNDRVRAARGRLARQVSPFVDQRARVAS